MSDLELKKKKAKAKLKLQQMQQEDTVENVAEVASNTEEGDASEDINLTSSPEEVLEATQKKGTNEVASFVRSAADMATFGKFDEMVAAVETVGKVIEGETEFAVESIENTYNRQKDIEQELIRRAKQDNPWSATAGEIAGGAAQYAGAGAAGLPIAGIKSLGTTATLTGLQSVARNDEIDYKEIGKDVGSGVVLDSIFMGLGKFVKSGFSAAKSALGFAPVEAVASRTSDLKKVGEYLKQTAAPVDSNLPFTVRAKQKTEAYRESLKRFTDNLTEGNMPIVQSGLDADEMLERSIIKQKSIGKEIGNILSSIDESAKVELDTTEIERKLLKDIVDPLLESDLPERVALGQKLAETIQGALNEETIQITKKVVGNRTLPSGATEPIIETVENITRTPKKGFNLRRLHNLYRDIADGATFPKGANASIDETKIAEQKAKIAGSMIGTIEELVDAHSKKIIDADDALSLAAFKNRKQAFRDTLVASEVLSQTASEVRSSSGLSAMASRLVGLKGFVLGSAIGASVLDKSAILPLSLGINLLRNAQGVPSSLGVAGKNIANFMEKFPKSPKTEAMMRNLVASASIGAASLEKEIATQAARVSFLERPLERNVEDVRARASSLHHLINKNSPEMANQFRELLEKGTDDEIGAFVDMLSKDKDASELVQDGIGFNGRLYSQEDKDIISSDVKINRNLSRLKRLKLIQRVQSEGYIPTEEDLEDERQPRQFIPRNKSIQEI